MDTEVYIDEKATEKLLKTFDNAYHKAPYFKDVFPLVKETIVNANQHKTVDILAMASLQSILAYLGIQKEIVLSSEKHAATKNLDRADRLIAICKAEQCTTYINASGGKELYSKEYFKKNDINLYFLETKPYKYKQYGNDFIPNLSIIDLLMFNDIKGVSAFLSMYELN
jgi:hypothetical protein